MWTLKRLAYFFAEHATLSVHVHFFRVFKIVIEYSITFLTHVAHLQQIRFEKAVSSRLARNTSLSTSTSTYETLHNYEEEVKSVATMYAHVSG